MKVGVGTPESDPRSEVDVVDLAGIGDLDCRFHRSGDDVAGAAIALGFAFMGGEPNGGRLDHFAFGGRRFRS